MKLTTRKLASAPEVRASTDPASPGNKLVGYAARFNCESEVLYDVEVLKDAKGNPLPFVEVLDPGVFERTLRERPDVRALYNHDTSALLGRTKSGTLTLAIDPVGLLFDDLLPRSVDGWRAAELVGRGDIDGCSFGFQIVRNQLVERAGMPALHTVIDVDLYEVSIAVTFPAYPQTVVVAMRTRNRGTTPTPTPRLDQCRRRLRVEGP